MEGQNVAESRSGKTHARHTAVTIEESGTKKPKEAFLTTRNLIILSLPVLTPQIGWTVAEVFIVTYLLRLGASPVVANLVWLLNPVISLFVQPIVGNMSEGRRFFFVCIFHVLALIGMLMITFAESIYLYFRDPAEIEAEGVNSVLVCIIFTGVALADLSFDTIAIPARALLHENVSKGQLEYASVIFSNTNTCGAIVGLLLTLSDLESFVPFSFFETHMRATYAAVILLTMLSLGVMLLLFPKLLQRTALSRENAGIIAYAAEPELNFAMLKEICFIFCSVPSHIGYMWLVSCIWWWCILGVTFWWTAWITFEVLHAPPNSSQGHSDSFETAISISVLCGLLLYLSTYLFSFVTQYCNNKFGILKTFHFGAIFHSCFLMSLWFERSVASSLIVYAAEGFVITILTTNPFLIVEDYISEQEKLALANEKSNEKEESHLFNAVKTRGMLIALMNLAMTVGQIIVALLSGILIGYTNGDITIVFVFPGVLLFITSLTMFVLKRAQQPIKIKS